MSVSYPYPLPPSYYPPVQAAAAVTPESLPVFTPHAVTPVEKIPTVKIPDVKPESKVATLIEDLFPEDEANPDTILTVVGDSVIEEPWPINPETGRPISRQAMYKRRKKQERLNEAS